MARSILSDLLQSHTFWLLDAAPIEPLSLPMLTPLFGFSAITAPEIQVETKEITEGNWYFKRKIVKTADVTPITLERGVTFYDSDFWRWISGAISGTLTNTKIGPVTLGGSLTPRRSLLLVQFMPRPTLTGVAGLAAGALTQGALATGGAALAGAGSSEVAAAGLTTGLLGGVSAALQGFGIGPFEFTARVPAKAWMLHGCIPTRYKVGLDFDASKATISIQQCEISVEALEEVALVA